MKLRKASKVKLGDCLFVKFQDSITEMKILQIQKRLCRGAYAPLTQSELGTERLQETFRLTTKDSSYVHIYSKKIQINNLEALPDKFDFSNDNTIRKSGMTGVKEIRDKRTRSLSSVLLIRMGPTAQLASGSSGDLFLLNEYQLTII
uniref:Uncharacterized protein n=1 Tax=Romanomermis culicivorax TaxID=13658 RepID=A0A915LAQ1_ROMCU